MPNWCNNTLRLSGSPKALADFESKYNSRQSFCSKEEPAIEPVKVGLLTAFLPTPKELMDESAGPPSASSTSADYLVAKYGCRDWYEWRIKYWGTKWDVMGSGELFGHQSGTLFAAFESAWSPPIPGILAISKMFPDVQFDLCYEEPGCNFEGQFVALGGENIADLHRSFTEGELIDPDDEDSDRECIPLEDKFEPHPFHC